MGSKGGGGEYVCRGGGEGEVGWGGVGGRRARALHEPVV